MTSAVVFNVTPFRMADSEKPTFSFFTLKESHIPQDGRINSCCHFLFPKIFVLQYTYTPINLCTFFPKYLHRDMDS
jgi:hypothetical protein